MIDLKNDVSILLSKTNIKTIENDKLFNTYFDQTMY